MMYYCRGQNHVCSSATKSGYCKLTACVSSVSSETVIQETFESKRIAELVAKMNEMTDVHELVNLYSEAEKELHEVFNSRFQKVMLRNRLDHTLTDKQKILEHIDDVEKEHPYKMYGDPETYSQYNEAWCDALDRVRSFIDAGCPNKEDGEKMSW